MQIPVLSSIQTIGYCRVHMHVIMSKKRIKQMAYISNSDIRIEPNTDFT